MKKPFTTSSLIIAALTAGIALQAQLPVRKVDAAHLAPSPAGQFVQAKARMNADSEAIKAEFSVKGMATSAVTWSENFNSGTLPEGWTKDNASNVTWKVKTMSGNYAFTEIDPDDSGSLFVEGPYSTARRETSRMTSASLAAGSNATLKAYVGFSRNYDDYCRLTIEVSADGFAEDITALWCSGDDQGQLPWCWHPLELDLGAYSGKTIQLRFVYGPGGKDSFQTGGYMGDFAIDGLELASVATIDGVDVVTGERITFVDLSTPEGAATSWLWNMPGATPATSTGQNPEVYYTLDGTYDVSLTVTDASGAESTVTKAGYVKVTGTEPEAKIGLPATFRYFDTKLPLVAPLVPVTFTDASAGFPTSQSWQFSGVDPTPNASTSLEGPSVDVAYYFLHEQSVALSVANRHGTSEASERVSVEYGGNITNFRSDDRTAVFDLEGRGEFPGTNSMNITAYAEKFSKPSRPMVVYGAYVYFTQAQAEEVADQIANVGCHLYTSENGLPGKRLDSMWWSVFELNTPAGGSLTGTEFPFTECPVVDDEFFIVVDGIPAKSETCTVSFAMADFRAEGNTAYMLKDGEWVDVSTYFPAGKNHTSYLITPVVAHSVISNLPQDSDPTVTFLREGGSKDYEIFSYLGYKTPVETSADWVRVTNEPNGMTVDNLTIEADPLPAGATERRAEIHLTDGASTFTIPVVQTAESAAAAIGTTNDAYAKVVGNMVEIFVPGATDYTLTDMLGRTIARGPLTDGRATLPLPATPGIYLLTTPTRTFKIAR